MTDAASEKRSRQFNFYFRLQQSDFRLSASVPKVSAAREHHRQSPFVRGGDHFGVPDGAARLHDGGRARIGDGIEAVPEREERVGGGDGARERAAAFITATFTASTRLICPAPTASVRSAVVKITAFDFT